MKKIIPFVIIVAVLCSVLPLKLLAIRSTTIKRAATIYGSNTVGQRSFIIDYRDINATYELHTTVTYNSITYTVDRYALPSSFSITSNRVILMENLTGNSNFVLSRVTQIGSTGVYFIFNTVGTTKFYLGFNDYNVVINTSDYAEGTKDHALAALYNEAKENNNIPILDRLAVITASTVFDVSTVISGTLGNVNQGIMTQNGTLLTSYFTNYYYNATDMTVSFILFKEWNGVPATNGYWLYIENYDPSFYSFDGGSGSQYSYSFDDNGATVSMQITLTGQMYINNQAPTEARYKLVEVLLWALFDVEPIFTSQYVWCVPATIDQNQQQQIVDNGAEIIDKLDQILEKMQGEQPSQPSHSNEDQLVDAIDTGAINQAGNVIRDFFAINNYSNGVKALLYMSTPWTQSYAFKAIIAITSVGFLIFTIIRGLKKK